MRGEDVAVAIVDATLSPVQQRNLEREWGCKVIDRTGLILDIFGERARTREGSLQVATGAPGLPAQPAGPVLDPSGAAARRLRLPRRPGETQIEADRRLITDRIVRLKKDLDQVRRTRGLHRTARTRTPFPVVALVGYTNAGKSTLFNALTGAQVHAQDQLFATLDPTMRGLRLPSGRRVILSDTVGFISELPTELVAAFRATLEEVAEADVILHVRDAAHPDSAAQRADVAAVLEGLEKDGTLDAAWRERTVEVLNKADLLGGVGNVPARVDAVPISAVTGEGLPVLLGAIDLRIAAGMEQADYAIRRKTARGSPGCTSMARCWSAPTRRTLSACASVCCRPTAPGSNTVDRRGRLGRDRAAAARRRPGRGDAALPQLAPGAVRTKSGPSDLVTEADEAAEAMITTGLQRLHPGCLVVGEEACAADSLLLGRMGDAELAFVVDPIDGTSTFVAGLPLFGVMAAAVVAGEVVAAAIHDPVGDDTAVAIRGQGAGCRRRRASAPGCAWHSPARRPQ